MTNQCQDQPRYDELLDELRHTIRFQGEQIREAVAILTDVDCVPRERIYAFLDQNSEATQ